VFLITDFMFELVFWLKASLEKIQALNTINTYSFTYLGPQITR
jgi:hypothetical protein